MSRGNQRDVDRARAQARTAKANAGKRTDGLTPEQRREGYGRRPAHPVAPPASCAPPPACGAWREARCLHLLALVASARYVASRWCVLRCKRAPAGVLKRALGAVPGTWQRE